MEQKTVKLTITDMTEAGAGFGRDNGLAVFVPGAVPGDIVLVEITKQKKNFADARLTEIVEESADRITPLCPDFDRCGGCSLLNMSYESQLRLKQRQVRDKIERLGGVENPVVHDVIGMDEPFNYRNKGEYPVAFSGDKSYVGFYERKSHRIVDAAECALQCNVANLTASVIRKYNKGEIKQIIVKTAFGSGEVMLILECEPDKVKWLEDMIHELDDKIYEMSECADEGSVEYNASLEAVYALDNGKYKLLAGKKTITDEVLFDNGMNLKFEISAPSFYQVNTAQMKKLYAKAAEYAGLDGSQTVLDLYCGIGTIGLSMAKDAKEIIGIEIVKEAVIDANRNAVINGIVNARYICGKAEEILPACVEEKEWDEMSGEEALARALRAGNIVAVLDPPRAGCDRLLLESIAKAGIGKIVYISCDAASLARDISILKELGYTFEEASPVDMFPHTMHIETVALLTRT